METSPTPPAENSGQSCGSCNCKGSPLLLLALLLMTLGLGLFFFRQARSLNKQVLQDQQIIKDYNNNYAAPGTRFIANLQQFAKSNPDFGPILQKYQIGGVGLDKVQPQPLK